MKKLLVLLITLNSLLYFPDREPTYTSLEQENITTEYLDRLEQYSIDPVSCLLHTPPDTNNLLCYDEIPVQAWPTYCSQYYNRYGYSAAVKVSHLQQISISEQDIENTIQNEDQLPADIEKDIHTKITAADALLKNDFITLINHLNNILLIYQNPKVNSEKQQCLLEHTNAKINTLLAKCGLLTEAEDIENRIDPLDSQADLSYYTQLQEAVQKNYESFLEKMCKNFNLKNLTKSALLEHIFNRNHLNFYYQHKLTKAWSYYHNTNEQNLKIVQGSLSILFCSTQLQALNSDLITKLRAYHQLINQYVDLTYVANSQHSTIAKKRNEILNFVEQLALNLLPKGLKKKIKQLNKSLEISEKLWTTSLVVQELYRQSNLVLSSSSH